MLIVLSAVVALMLTTTLSLSESAVDAKKSNIRGTGSSSKSSINTAVTHIRGVKVLRVHTVPLKVTIGSTFGIRGIVVNNSTSTITFINGTCTLPLPVAFNKNVVSEPKIATASCKAQKVTLEPGGHSAVLNSATSGILYRATSSGITNATLTFKYMATSPTSKTPITDSISRVYTFNILPSTASSSTSAPITSSARSHAPSILPPPTANSQPGILRLIT